MNRRSKFLAQIAFYGLGAGLLVYAASRTLAFVQNTMSADRQILGYLYLLATGIGALVWLFVLLTYAEGAKQRGIAFGMGIIDLCAELVLVYADTVRVSAENQLLKMTESEMQTFIVASVAAVGLNIIAVYFFKLFDPSAEATSKARDLVDETADAAYKQLNTPEARRQMIDDLDPVLRSAIMADVTEQVYSAAGRYLTGNNRAMPAPGWPKEATTSAIPAILEHKEKPDFFGRLRNPLRPKPQTQTGTNDSVVWTETQDGQRNRMFCLQCFHEGKDWTSPEPCEHMQDLTGQPATIHANGPTSIPIPPIADPGPVG